jgi:prepilin peptidase CpaA
MTASTIADFSLLILKSVAIVMLIRIAYLDLVSLRIRNDHVLPLLATALAIVILDFMRTRDLIGTLTLLGAAALVFVVLFVLWMLKKVGAGDVKLLAIMPLLVGINGSVTFVLALLVVTLLIYAAMKFPMLLPQQLYKAQLEAMRRDRRIPFGVPIAFAAILALLLPVGLLLRAPTPAPVSELSLGDLR